MPFAAWLAEGSEKAGDRKKRDRSDFARWERANLDRLTQRGPIPLLSPSASRRVRRGHFPGSIGIREGHEKTMPIGIQARIGPTNVHPALWTRRAHRPGVPRRSVPSSGNSSPASASRSPVHKSDPPHLDASSIRRFRQHSESISENLCNCSPRCADHISRWTLRAACTSTRSAPLSTAGQ